MTELRLLQGGRSGRFRVGDLEIAMAPRERPPFPVEALAVEDDTYHVLAADPAYREPTEHALRVMTAAHEAEPTAPGAVVVRSGHPLRLLAVVHDLGRTPTWSEEWIESALQELLEVAESRRLRSLRLTPLGSQHGSLPIDRFMALLESAIAAAPPVHLRRIWLVVP